MNIRCLCLYAHSCDKFFGSLAVLTKFYGIPYCCSF